MNSLGSLQLLPQSDTDTEAVKHEPQGHPRSWMKKRAAKTAVVGLIAAVALSASGCVPEEDTLLDEVTTTELPVEIPTTTEQAVEIPTTTQAEEPVVTTTSAPPTTTTPTTTTRKPVVTTTSAPPTTTIPEIGSGTYIVGEEFAPGVYRVDGYWARLDDDFEIIDNGLVFDYGLELMIVSQSDSYIEISGEAIPLSELPSLDPFLFKWTEGTYLVGPDIQPGTYRVSDPNYAYGARLDKNLDIIDNEGNSGNILIRVEESDYAFTYSGELELIS